MVVRVRVRLINESTGRSSEIIVLVNGGAESEVPVIAVTPSTPEIVPCLHRPVTAPARYSSIYNYG